MRRNLSRWAPAGVICLLALLAAPWLLDPPCPTHVVMASGEGDGAYHAFAVRYREILARQGITLEVRTTAGSVENNRLLLDDDSGVSLALMQGGTATPESDGKLVSLASLYLEPIWVFHRGDKPIAHLGELRGKRIAVGAAGSGTRALALKLLEDNKVTPPAADDDSTRLVECGVSEAVEQLKAGEIDAAFFVISSESPIVRELLQTVGIQVMNFRRAEAYLRKYPFLSSVTLPEGLINFPANIPAHDVALLAPAANLVARADLHPALIPLFLHTAEEVHDTDGPLARLERFPSSRFVEYPLDSGARRYFRAGPSFFYRYLPFWLASWLDRMKLVLLPMCTLAFPLLKAAPPVYRWRIRSKIYRWYRVLREIDQKLRDARPDADFSQEIAKLVSLEHELTEVTVPLSYMEEFYNLRLHVSFVLGQLQERNGKGKRLRIAA